MVRLSSFLILLFSSLQVVSGMAGIGKKTLVDYYSDLQTFHRKWLDGLCTAVNRKAAAEAQQQHCTSSSKSSLAWPSGKRNSV